MPASVASSRADLLRLRQSAGQLKSATLGGEQETQFEQAFASLAYSYLRDKAPRLLSYMIGFQLVDRNDENTRAVGVFGFQIGRNWVYTPVFFLNGEIKGNELMYIKERDSFLPLDEGWINYILSNQRKPDLGVPVTRNPMELGIRQPDLAGLSQPRFGKSGAARPVVFPNVAQIGWAEPFKPFQPVYAALTVGDFEDSFKYGMAKVAEASPSGLLERILQNSLVFCKAAYQVCEAYPLIKQAFDQWHGPDFFEKALLNMQAQFTKTSSVLDDRIDDVIVDYNFRGGAGAAKRRRKNVLGDAPVQDKVAVFWPTGRDLVGLSDEESDSLFRRGYLIRDKRAEDETTMAYDVSEPLALQPPDRTGIYEVLQKPAGFKKCLIIDAPLSDNGPRRFFTCVDLESKASVNADSDCIFAKPDEDFPGDYERWFDDLSSSALEVDGLYVFVTKNGKGTVPVRLMSEISTDKTLFNIDARSYADVYRVPGHGGYAPGYPDCSPCSPSMRNLLRVDSPVSGGIVANDGTIDVPVGAKAIKLKSAKKNEHGYYDYKDEQAIKDEALWPGNPLEMQLAIHNKTAVLKLHTIASEISINNGPLRSKAAGLVELVCRHGLDEGQACDLVKRAESASVTHKALSLRVIYGPGYPLTKESSDLMPPPNGPSVPMDPADGGYFGSLPATTTDQQLIPAPQDNTADPSIYDMSQQEPDLMSTMQQAQQSASTGQKEVFDTTMLSGLLKSMKHDNVLSKYSGDLLKALDRLGRILMIFYWRNEYFAERYGKAELPELEDALRNSFEALGECTLFILERDAGPLFGGHNEINVDDTAAM